MRHRGSSRVLPAVTRFTLVSTLLCGCFADAPDVHEGDDDETTGESGESSGAEASSTAAVSSTAASGSSASGTTTASTSNATASEGSDDGTASGDPTGTSGDEESGTTDGSQDEVLVDLAAELCTATWRNELDAVIACPTLASDPMANEGSVFSAEDEGFPVDTLGIFVESDGIAMHPRWVPGGEIAGRYPAREYEAGDHVRATIACVQATACEVEVTIAWATPDTKPQQIESVTLSFADSEGYDVDVEIPEMAGAVQVVLIVNSGNDSSSDGVAWISPRVVRPAA